MRFAEKAGSVSLVWKFAYDFLRPQKRLCFLVAGLTIFSVLLALPIPILSMFMIDRAVTLKELSLLKTLGIVFVFIVIFRHVLAFLSEVSTLWLKEQIIFQIQKVLVEKIQRLPLALFTERHSVYLQSRVMNDARAVEGALIGTFISLLIDGVTLLMAFGVLLWLRPQLGLFLAIFLTPFVGLRFYANRRMRSFSMQMQETQARTSAIVNESFAGIRAIKSYCRQEYQSQVVSDWLKRLRDIYFKTNSFGIFSTVGSNFVTAACMTFMLWYGCYHIIHGNMTLGQVFAIVLLLGYIYTPVNGLVGANFRIQQSAAAIARIYEFLDSKPERQTGSEVLSYEGKIEFRRVSFSYPGSSQPVLKDVSFTIPARSTIALVGRTGAGKSTLINLLLGFYEPGAGSIHIDDRDTSDISLGCLRQMVGLVDQHPFLFSGSIAENIRFGRPESSHEEIVEACQMSHASEFVDRLENSYETLVGERGVRLSGGQRQRIALARVFLKKPRILMLDEAVSEIDSESEKCMHQAILPLLGNCTTILVAHRLSSLMLADHVLVLDEGMIVEQGSHRSLMRANGVYARLFQEQFSMQEQEPVAISELNAD
ncbi:MAG TPA: ABC transporter ATP-binding protein [Candidatus Angelobacter sp.]|nr:ABC transporter ATP-binding protein [Candidatus Angelobacter sp.]